MRVEPPQITGLDGEAVDIDGASLGQLAGSLNGPLLRPGDEGFDDAILIWNGMVKRRPALVLQPTGVEDVVTGVRFAGEQELLLSIKGGGHNIAGTSVAEGGVMLDMSRLKRVDVDGERRRVRVGPGCILRDVDRVTQEHGFATVLGFISETGVAGLTLGGGFGYLTRRFGYTVDNLDEVEIVTADGEVRRASRTEHEDLFWAVRGGGGNFGVVTEFIYRLHRVGPAITGGLIAWSAEEADEVLGMYRRISGEAPRELTLALTMRMAPPAPFVPPAWHGKPIIAMVVCHTGDQAQAAADLAPIRGLGRPIVDLIVPKTYVEQQTLLDATQPKGLHYYWKTEFVPALPDGLLQSFREQAAAMASPLSQMILFHVAGALNERDADDGSVGNRGAAYFCAAAGSWRPDDAGAGEHRSWVRTAWEAIRPHSTGGNYVNFQTEDEGDDRTREAYGANYAKLAAIKGVYDPDNRFRANRNITPR